MTLPGSLRNWRKEKVILYDQQTNVAFFQLLPVLLNSVKEGVERLAVIMVTICIEILPFSQNQCLQNPQANIG